MRNLAKETEDLAREAPIRKAVQDLIEAQEKADKVSEEEVTIQTPEGKSVKFIIRRVPSP